MYKRLVEEGKLRPISEAPQPTKHSTIQGCWAVAPDLPYSPTVDPTACPILHEPPPPIMRPPAEVVTPAASRGRLRFGSPTAPTEQPSLSLYARTLHRAIAADSHTRTHSAQLHSVLDRDGAPSDLPSSSPPPLSSQERRCGTLIAALSRLTSAPQLVTFLVALGALSACAGVAADAPISSMLAARGAATRFVGGGFAGLLVWCAWTVLFSLCSAALCAAVPASEGSGIPHVKSLLSGSSLPPRFLSLTVGGAKLAGLITAAGAGLSIGKEGPFVHVAATAAHALWRHVPYFDAIRVSEGARRTALAAAVAAGVTGVFGTPIGAVLFSIEVTSTIMAVSTLPRLLLCAASARLVYDLLFSLREEDQFTGTAFPAADASWQLVAYAGLGGVCGLAGSLCVLCLSKARVVRRLLVTNTRRRVAFVGGAALLVGALSYSSAFTMQSDRDAINLLFRGRGVADGVASHAVADANSALAGEAATAAAALPLPLLALFFVVRLVSTIVSTSLPIACGIFLPLFTLGATLGRFTGEVLALLLPLQGIQPGTYAIVGAAALISGATQTISTALMVCEMTGQISHLLPVLLGTLSAVSVSSLFTVGVYDVLAQHAGLPYLPRVLPDAVAGKRVGDVMHSLGEAPPLQRAPFVYGCGGEGVGERVFSASQLNGPSDSLVGEEGGEWVGDVDGKAGIVHTASVPSIVLTDLSSIGDALSLLRWASGAVATSTSSSFSDGGAHAQSTSGPPANGDVGPSSIATATAVSDEHAADSALDTANTLFQEQQEQHQQLALALCVTEFPVVHMAVDAVTSSITHQAASQQYACGDCGEGGGGGRVGGGGGALIGTVSRHALERMFEAAAAAGGSLYLEGNLPAALVNGRSYLSPSPAGRPLSAFPHPSTSTLSALVGASAVSAGSSREERRNDGDSSHAPRPSSLTRQPVTAPTSLYHVSATSTAPASASHLSPVLVVASPAPGGGDTSSNSSPLPPPPPFRSASPPWLPPHYAHGRRHQHHQLLHREGSCGSQSSLRPATENNSYVSGRGELERGNSSFESIPRAVPLASPPLPPSSLFSSLTSFFPGDRVEWRPLRSTDTDSALGEGGGGVTPHFTMNIAPPSATAASASSIEYFDEEEEDAAGKNVHGVATSSPYSWPCIHRCLRVLRRPFIKPATNPSSRWDTSRFDADWLRQPLFHPYQHSSNHSPTTAATDAVSGAPSSLLPPRQSSAVTAPLAGRLSSPYVSVDAAPFQVSDALPLPRLHYLFAACLLQLVWVTREGVLVGVVLKEDLQAEQAGGPATLQ